MEPFAWVMLCFAVYRATRFAMLDTMFDDTRDRLDLWLAAQCNSHDGIAGALLRKIHDGAFCAFCVSVWLAAGAVWFWTLTDYEWSWASIIHILSISAGAMAVYRYIDPPE